MLKHSFASIVFFLVTIAVCSAQITGAPPMDASAKDKGDQVTITVRSYIHHISDIDIRNQQYKIEIWLTLMATDSLQDWDTLAHQFQVKGAKELSVTVVPQFHTPGATSEVIDSKSKKRTFRKWIKLNCTMAQDWDVDNFPFDKQNLDIICYTVRPKWKVILMPDTCNIGYNADCGDRGGDIENGWFVVGNSVKVDATTQKDISRSPHAAIRYCMLISRRHTWPLFLKLFIGMYVSFFVAFIAFFIDVTHVEPRFGLPVGGLFAAIGNKYIMEGNLPPTSQYTIVDALHMFTIVPILLMIFFSAISLRLAGGYFPTDDRLTARIPLHLKQMKWIDKNGAKFIFWTYAALNILSISWAIVHEQGWI
jgi:hypothetical protein